VKPQLNQSINQSMVGTHEEGEVDDDKHRPGADGAAEDGRAASTSVVIRAVSAAASSTAGAVDTTPAGVTRPSSVHVRHWHRAHHPVVHHRFRHQPDTEVGRKSVDGPRPARTCESQTCRDGVHCNLFSVPFDFDLLLYCSASLSDS